MRKLVFYFAIMLFATTSFAQGKFGIKGGADLYKIDPNMILAGGLSAGAITTIQAAYFDESDGRCI